MGKDTKKPAAGGKKGGDNKKTDTKDKGGDKGGKKGGKDELKPANSVNVRHILCEKLSDIEKARERIDAGEGFDKVRYPIIRLFHAGG